TSSCPGEIWLVLVRMAGPSKSDPGTNQFREGLQTKNAKLTGIEDGFIPCPIFFTLNLISPWSRRMSLTIRSGRTASGWVAPPGCGASETAGAGVFTAVRGARPMLTAPLPAPELPVNGLVFWTVPTCVPKGTAGFCRVNLAATDVTPTITTSPLHPDGPP